MTSCVFSERIIYFFFYISQRFLNIHMAVIFLLSVTRSVVRIGSAATSSPAESAELKVFHTYRSASCVHNRIRVSPARLVSPCVKAVKCYALLSPESEGMQDAQVRTGGVLFSSCKEPIPNVSTLLSVGGQLFLCDAVSFSSSRLW